MPNVVLSLATDCWQGGSSAMNDDVMLGCALSNAGWLGVEEGACLVV